MKQFTIANKEFQIPENWDDIYLWQYIEYAKLIGAPEMDDIRLVEVLCGLTTDELDTLLIKDYNELVSQIKDTFKPEDIKAEQPQYFTIDGVDYIIRDAKSMDDLTLGENASIDIVRRNDPTNFFQKVLAIIIRPGKVIVDEETKEERFEIEEFGKKDIINLEYRADLFMKKARATDILPTLNFFLSMKHLYEKAIQLSSQKNQMGMINQ